MKFWRALDSNDILEGGKEVVTRYAWDKDGGGTKGGVTQATFSDYLREYNLPDRDVETMTPEERTGVIFHRYWMPTGMMLPAGIDFLVFQFGYNAHPRTAIKNLQPLIPGYYGKIDGIIGPLALEAMHEVGKNKNVLRCLMSEYSAAQGEFYERLHAKDSTRPIKGWKNRTRKALEMALGDLTGAI